jgi:DNA repair exonuclease SbcCD ATPase subunit
MNRCRTLTAVLPLFVGALAGCAGERVPPKALVDAREEFVRTREGIAMQFDPTDVHEADLALQRAESAWRDAPDDPSTTDLAMIADRKARIARAEAETIKATQDVQLANAQLQATRSAQLQNAESQLSQTQTQLQQQQQTAAAQQQQLRDLESKLKDARDTIAKIATVKDDSRGVPVHEILG